MDSINITAPIYDGFTDPRPALTVLLCKNKEGAVVLQVHNSMLLTKQVFPKLITAVIGSYIIDMKGRGLIEAGDVEEMEAKILDEVSTLITTMKPEKLDNPETT